MESSGVQGRTRLYREAVLGVVLVFAVAGATLSAFAQYAKKRPVNKGPRAVGLLELTQNGKAHLIPVAIMIDGRFYDASAYKADPVPMALDSDTVYEAVKSGVSQGLFTVSGAVAARGSWVADGKWRTAAEIEADKARVKARTARKNQTAPEDVGGPPKLRRAPNSSGDNSSKPAPGPTAPQPAPSPPSSQNPGGTSPNPPAASPSGTHGGGSSQAPGGAGESSPSLDSPDRPILRRESPSETAHEQTKDNTASEPLQGPIQLVPAISDAGGPEPRPYAYSMKPEEEQNFKKKMLAMAAEEVKQRAERLMAESAPSTSASTKRNMHAPRVPPAAPEFQDAQMKVFDLTSSNEPVLVLTASATIPNAKLNLEYSTALVAREDIYGELHKVFAQTTDNEHLDVLAKYEFIDAVDADGDGRGELLFRTTSDAGSAFSIYAVIGDTLWPLFEGKPGA